MRQRAIYIVVDADSLTPNLILPVTLRCGRSYLDLSKHGGVECYLEGCLG